jgi:hypothetical protein
MSVKAKAPKEDPETKRRRELEEARADAEIIENTREDVTREALEVSRQFGRRARQQPNLGSLNTRLFELLGQNRVDNSNTFASSLFRQGGAFRGLGSIGAA